MPTGPFTSEVMFRVGPAAVIRTVVTTSAIVALLAGASFAATRRLRVEALGKL